MSHRLSHPLDRNDAADSTPPATQPNAVPTMGDSMVNITPISLPIVVPVPITQTQTDNSDVHCKSPGPPHRFSNSIKARTTFDLLDHFHTTVIHSPEIKPKDNNASLSLLKRNQLNKVHKKKNQKQQKTGFFLNAKINLLEIREDKEPVKPKCFDNWLKDCYCLFRKEKRKSQTSNEKTNANGKLGYNPRILVATSGATNTSINSDIIYGVYRLDMPSSRIDIVQERGRAGRFQDASPEQCHYCINFLMSSFEYKLIQINSKKEDVLDYTY